MTVTQNAYLKVSVHFFMFNVSKPTTCPLVIHRTIFCLCAKQDSGSWYLAVVIRNCNNQCHLIIITFGSRTGHQPLPKARHRESSWAWLRVIPFSFSPTQTMMSFWESASTSRLRLRVVRGEFTLCQRKESFLSVHVQYIDGLNDKRADNFGGTRKTNQPTSQPTNKSTNKQMKRTHKNALAHNTQTRLLCFWLTLLCPPVPIIVFVP